MSIPTFTNTGTKSTTSAKLDKTVFESPIKNHELLKATYDAYLSNGRKNLAVVKTRGLVRGGGKKPWKQKGTGRARFGSSRNPIWRGGGIVFGPTGEENYSKKMNTKSKRLALCQALSLAVTGENVSVIDDIKVANGKTAELVGLLAKLQATRNVLIVVDLKTPELLRASSNLQDVKVSTARYLNVFDVLNADQIMFTKKGLEAVTEWLKTDPSINKEEAK
jgi:large subunit ribosomal protein L4